MEDGNGLEFGQSVRKVSDVYLIFLTALDQEVDIVNGYDAGQMTTLPSFQPDGADIQGQCADAQD